MRTLHILNKSIASMLMLLKSFSGAGLVLFIVFLFDLGANALGVQVFIGQRMIHMIEALNLTAKTAFIVSACFSLLASSTLGLVIMQATLHNKRIHNAILSLLSVALSFFGLSYLIFEKGFKAGDLGSMDLVMWISIIIVLILAVTPPIAYNMNANLVVENFGKILDEFNEASKKELQKSFTADVATLGSEDVATTRKQSQKRMRKMGIKQQDKSPVSVGVDTDFDTLFKNINHN